MDGSRNQLLRPRRAALAPSISVPAKYQAIKALLAS